VSFVYPWVLLGIPILLWLLRGRISRTSLPIPSLQLWSNQKPGRTRYLWVPIGLRRLVLVLLLVALARPQAGSTYSLDVSEGIAIQLLVDVSSSMDMSMQASSGSRRTRMELAKEMVARFIAGDGETLSGRPDDLIGLITFARYADTRSPLTFGHEALLQIVANLQIQERPNEDGTAYGDALAVAAARLKNLEELQFGESSIQADTIASKVIILLTDGENNSGTHLPIEAAGLAKEWGCRIYVISLAESEPYPEALAIGNALTPAEQTLQYISEETGGIFRQASDFESLLSVYEEIDRMVRSEISTRSFDRVADWFGVPLGLALLCLLVALTLEATVLRVVP